MAKNKRLSLLQQQKAKLKAQRALATTPKAKAIVDRRIQRVTVQIQNTQKQLTGSSANRSLPPGKKGGAIKPKVKSQGSVSAKRAIKAAELERAKQGTKGPTRTGQPSGGVNRKFGANVVNAATKRAQQSAALRTAGKLARVGVSKAAQLLTGDGSGQLALGAVTASNLIDAARGSTAAERNANKPKKESKPSRITSGGNTNRRGRRITSSSSKPTSSKPTKSGSSESAASLARKQGLANNQRAAGMSADLRGSVSKKATAKPTTKPSGGSTAKKQPTFKPAAKKTSSVSGVGPVKSGSTYAVSVKKKSISQQRVDQLKKMGKDSDISKRLRAEAKAKSIAQGKKNRGY